MDFKELLFITCLALFGGLTSTTTTTTFVSAMSTVNSDFERFLRVTNASQTLATIEERIAVDTYVLAFLNYTYTNANQDCFEFGEEKGRYGEGRVMNVRGLLVHVTDAADKLDDTACSENILGTHNQPIPPAPWIALVRRGRCTFEEKVKHVWQKGAAGVIIYNDKTVTNLEKMQIKDKKRNIAAVITYQYIGEEMVRIVDAGNEVWASINEGRSGRRPINTLNKTSVLFVSISFIVLMIISLVWLIFYYVQRFRYLQTKDQQSRHLCSVTKRAIMKIPTKTGKSSDEKDSDNDCCAICIEVYKSTDCIRVLPCKHEFHKNCIDPWLIEHRTCPMCKLDVLKYYGYVVGDQTTTTTTTTATPTAASNPNPAPASAQVQIRVIAMQIPTANNTPALLSNAQSSSEGAEMPQLLQSSQGRNINDSRSNNNNNNSNSNNNNNNINTSCSSSFNCSDSSIGSPAPTQSVIVIPNINIDSSSSSSSGNSSSSGSSGSSRSSSAPIVTAVVPPTGTYTASRQVTDV